MKRRKRPELSLDHSLRQAFTARLLADNEPIRAMLAMQRAIRDVMLDLSTDEPADASEGLTNPEVVSILKDSRSIVSTLETMYRRLK